MELNEFLFGETSSKVEVKGFYVSNGDDLEITVINRGATLTSLKFIDRYGQKKECVLGFSTVFEYENHKGFYGATIGRVANRIGGATFNIDDRVYKLFKNDGNNSLHGGDIGFDKVIWSYETFKYHDRAGVTFTYISSDGEENYPGNLKCSVTYTLTKNNELIIEYKATTDKKTPVNLTNHAYWNLNGFKESIDNHNLQIDANSYLELDSSLIPTGRYLDVKDTPYDFRTLTRIGDNIGKIGGYDNNFNLSSKKLLSPLNKIYIEDPDSGRSMTIETTEPGVQFYTGFEEHNFFCLETQMYPDAVNKSNFDSIILSPNSEYYQKTIHKFEVKK